MHHRFFVLLLCLLVSQHVFSQKTEAAPSAPSPKVVTGTILLSTKKAPDAKALLAALKADWKLRTDSSTATDKTLVFSSGGATVMLAYLDYPANPAEIAAAARLSWLWKNAAAEASKHPAQVVISVLGTDNHTLDLYKLFTKVAAATLQSTAAIGTFMNTQYLLLPKDFYLSSARTLLNDNALPVYCWTYFGIMEEGLPAGASAQEGVVSSGYTYGLRDFGLEEMEIVKAKGSASETHATLFDAASSVIQYNTRLQDGQQFTTLEGAKLTARKSKAAFVDGDTFKLSWGM